MTQMKADLSFAPRAPMLALGLLVISVDIVLFSFLNQSANSLALAHIVSFLSTSLIALLATLSWPNFFLSACSAGKNTAKSIFNFSLLVLLLLFLRGGLLASLIQILAIPTLTAICMVAAFSALSLYASYFFAQQLKDASTETCGNALCLAAVGYIVLLKLFYLGVPELLFEEAYYWNYAQHLDIGYLDHPLIVAWTITAFTKMLGNIEFAVRFGAFLLWFITAYFAYKLACEVFNKTVAIRALLLVAALPAYFSFGYFMSPDAPLTACWAAAIYYCYQVFIKEDKAAWLKLGIALGFGMSSKYTIALLGAAIVLFMIFDKNARKWLLRPQPYLAALVALLLFSPVIIWNIQHDWLSFTFQSAGRLESSHHFSLPRFISNLLITLTPIGLLSVAALILFKNKLLENAKAFVSNVSNLNRSYFLLMWLGLFPVAVYAGLSLTRASKLNWTGPCWLGLMPFFALLLTQKTTESAPKLLAWCQRAWPATIVILLLIYGAGMHYLSLGFPRMPYPQNTHLMGYESFAREIEVIKTQLERETGEKILVVGMDRNKIASGLAFYRTKYLDKMQTESDVKPAFDTASEHLFGDVGLMYELWFPIAGQENKPMLLIGESIADLSSNAVLSRVKTAGEIKEMRTWENGKPTGRYYYRLVSGYHSGQIAPNN